MLYGRDFNDDITAIEQLETPVGEVAVNGMVMSVEPRPIRELSFQ